MNRPQYPTHRQYSDENGALRNPYGRDDRLRNSGYQQRPDNLQQLEQRFGSQREDRWSGADQRYFDDLDMREWDREGARQDGQSGWRSNPYEDGSYLGNDWRDSADTDDRIWHAGDSDRYSSANDGAKRQGASRRYGRQLPKGYVRSDERIRDDVCGHLYHADDVDLSDVGVDVSEGTITLQGMVPERRMKRRIEQIVEHCIGVRDVDNRIRIRPDAGGYLAQMQMEDA